MTWNCAGGVSGGAVSLGRNAGGKTDPTASIIWLILPRKRGWKPPGHKGRLAYSDCHRPITGGEAGDAAKKLGENVQMASARPLFGGCGGPGLRGGSRLKSPFGEDSGDICIDGSGVLGRPRLGNLFAAGLPRAIANGLRLGRKPGNHHIHAGFNHYSLSRGLFYKIPHLPSPGRA